MKERPKNFLRDKEITAKREAGMTYAELGRQYGITRNRARQVVLKQRFIEKQHKKAQHGDL